MPGRAVALTALAAVVLSAACVSTAEAEVVVFASGRTMSVSGHRDDGDSIVLLPRHGGEITCPRSTVARFEPDEVPYVDPDAVPAAEGTALADGSDAALDMTPPSGRGGAVDRHAFDPIISRMAAAHGVDARLVHAVIQVESGYRQDARSPKGAMGLMQLMPETARRYAVVNPYDPASNIDAGTRHLKSLLDRLPLARALAAYNAGELAVARFGGVPPYPETEDYVRRILQLVRH